MACPKCTPVPGLAVEAERASCPGATMAANHRDADGNGLAVLADPEANELCVLRSQAERGGF